MGIVISKDLCIGCGGCVGSCGNDAIEIVDGLAVVNADYCVMCGICLDACPVSAISSVKEEVKQDITSYHGIWVFVQQLDGSIMDVAYQLLGKGRELADTLGVRLTAVIFGYELTGLEALLHAGADDVLAVDHEALAYPMDGPYAELLTKLIGERKPEIVLYGATCFGRSMAPRVAANVKTGLTADCTILEIDKETKLLKQTRPAFGGNLMATIICPNNRPQMATVRPGVMTAITPDRTRKGRMEIIKDVTFAESGVTLLKRFQDTGGDHITDYDVLVVVGKGIGAKKNIQIAKQLAELLGGTYGVSRPLIDAGWAEYRHQVGQTGSSVSPKLLISAGVSGAIQHLAGIGGAETIIAINTDQDAPIFNVAQYAIVGDCLEVMRDMIAQLEAK